MNSFLKSSAFRAMLSLAMVTTSEAAQPESSTATNIKSAQTTNLIAQVQEPFRDSSPYRNFIYERRFLDEMIMQRMKMVGMAQEVFQSTKNPEIRQMAQEMITSGNNEIVKILAMRKKILDRNQDID